MPSPDRPRLLRCLLWGLTALAGLALFGWLYSLLHDSSRTTLWGQREDRQ